MATENIEITFQGNTLVITVDLSKTYGLSASGKSEVIDLANQGTPVIVGFPPQRYPGGHLVVVTGGSATLVVIADSSIWNRQTLTRLRFLHWWGGFVAVVIPQDGGSSVRIPGEVWWNGEQ